MGFLAKIRKKIKKPKETFITPENREAIEKIGEFLNEPVGLSPPGSYSSQSDSLQRLLGGLGSPLGGLGSQQQEYQRMMAQEQARSTAISQLHNARVCGIQIPEEAILGQCQPSRSSINEPIGRKHVECREVELKCLPEPD